jgi:hypothetical protein
LNASGNIRRFRSVIEHSSPGLLDPIRAPTRPGEDHAGLRSVYASPLDRNREEFTNFWRRHLSNAWTYAWPLNFPGREKSSSTLSR